MSPRKSTTDVLEAARKRVAELEAKAAERQKTQIQKLTERRALLVQREQKIAAQILEIDAQITDLAVESIDPAVQLSFDSVEADEV